MPNLIVINYEETSAIAKQFHDEGDDIMQLTSDTRQRVHALQKEWIGNAAEAFYEEMEADLLPALQRVSGALFLCNEVLGKMIKIIHEADEETAGFFNDDLNTDFGAGLFGQAGAGIGGVVGDDDFGAGKFGDALGGDTQTDGTPPAGTPPGDTPVPPPPAPQAPPTPETPPTEAETSAGGGGGGGGGDSGGHGIQGDLKGLGTGVDDPAQQTGAAGSNPQVMPDHIYGGDGSAGDASTQPSGPAGTPNTPGEQASPAGGVAAAAGAAGLAGAAAAGAKVLKENQDNPE